MTNRDFFVAVQNAEISDEMTAKAQELIDALDKRNDKRKSADSKEKRETASRRETVLSFLTCNSGYYTRDEIAATTNLTVGQVSSACTALIKAGSVEKAEIKVNKVRKTAYALKQ